jgi:hypothetical protein
MTAATPTPPDTPRTVGGRPILWNAFIFGVVSGALLAASAAYKIVGDDNGAWLAFAPLVVFAWLAAGYRASKWAVSVRTGVLAGLFAALLGASIGAAVDQVLAHQYVAQWTSYINTHCQEWVTYQGFVVNSGCTNGHTLSQQAVLDHELQSTIQGLVVQALFGLLLGWLGGLVGMGRGLRKALAGEYMPGQKIVETPVIPSSRSILSRPDTPSLSLGPGPDAPPLDDY